MKIWSHRSTCDIVLVTSIQLCHPFIIIWVADLSDSRIPTECTLPRVKYWIWAEGIYVYTWKLKPWRALCVSYLKIYVIWLKKFTYYTRLWFQPKSTQTSAQVMHQTITRRNVDSSSVSSCLIHMRVIGQVISNMFILKMSSKWLMQDYKKRSVSLHLHLCSLVGYWSPQTIAGSNLNPWTTIALKEMYLTNIRRVRSLWNVKFNPVVLDIIITFVDA